LEAFGAVFGIDGFPVADADGDDVTGVVGVDELLAGRFVGLLLGICF
jgi:hypothetical protein